MPAVHVKRGGEEEIEVLDASYRGMYVSMRSAPRINELLRFRVSLPMRDVTVHAVVVRLTRDRHDRVGVGLRLFAMNGADLVDWQQFVRVALSVDIAA